MAKETGLGFTGPVPARAIVDARLSSPSMLRLLALYCWHDRRSLSRNPPGAGCTASNKVLSARLGCDYTTLLKLRLRLEELGYIEVETRESASVKQYRLEVARVIPDHLADPEKWPFDPAYIGPECQKAWNKNHGDVAMKSEPHSSQIHGEATMKGSEKHGDPAMSIDENHGDELSETRRNPPKTDAQYIPRRGERYSSEEGERYSSEEARENGGAIDGQLASLERRFKNHPESIGSIADSITWLEGIAEQNPDDNGPIYQRAMRMLGDFDTYAAEHNGRGGECPPR